MFEHSVKVPRLYKTAARIAQKVKEDGSSLKQLVYEKKHPNVKALYALVLQTLRNEDNLNSIIRRTQILTKENRLDPWLARVLITELLWGKQKLPGDSKPIKTIISYQDEFLKDFTPENTAKTKKKKINKPKYVRINTLKMSVEAAIEDFRNDGMSLVRCGDGSDYSAFLATSASLSEEQFMIDTLIKDLLIFPPGSQFYDHKLYKNGCFVLQDKASCIAPFLLNPPKGGIVLDMCSAPGMKCMQLAAMVEKTGKVYAVERDQRRFATLQKLLDQADATHVKTINKDVLTLTDSDITDVEYILVDPSCSGSGILDRIEFEDEKSHCNESRLQKLAGFQITILRHALTNFKSAKRIVYSTCSIFPQENEQVVEQAITTVPDFKLVPLNETLKDKWYNFGSNEYKIGPKCLYAKPEIDRTNGFFIAVFERLKDGEKNEYFVRRVQRSSECENEIIDEEKQGNDENMDQSEQSQLKTNKKKKKRDKNKSETVIDDGKDDHLITKGKKRKANDENDQQPELDDTNDNFVLENDQPKSKKKKHKKNKHTSDPEVSEENNLTEESEVIHHHSKSCSKKKHRDKVKVQFENVDSRKCKKKHKDKEKSEEIGEHSHKKKKKSKKEKTVENAD